MPESPQNRRYSRAHCPFRLVRITMVLAVVGGWFSRGAAQQTLTESNPQPGAHLLQPPCAVRLTFIERVEMSLTEVVILTADRREVPLHEFHRVPRAPNIVLAAPGEQLRPGAYIVEWRAGGPDGHVGRGRFAFAVGATAANREPSRPNAEKPVVTCTGRRRDGS